MNYIPITSSRRSRRDKEVSARNKTWVRNTMIVVIVALILLLPILSQTVLATSSTILALFTLLLFASILTWLTIRLVRVVLTWMRGVNYGMEEVNASRSETAGGKVVEADMIIDAPRLQTKIFRGLESLLSITAWTFFLNLLQPFITAVLWWQGYQLIAGNAFSLASVEGTFTILESSVYFGIFVFLVLLSWSEWNYWRYGRLNRRRALPLVSPADLAVFFGVSLATVHKAQATKAATVVVDQGIVRFEDINVKHVKSLLLFALFSYVLCFPGQSMAASFSAPMSILGYDQDVMVTGGKTNLSIPFSVPHVALLPGSVVNLVIEPGKNLNDSSNFIFYMNDRQIASLTAGQLRAKPNVQLPLSPEAVDKGKAQVSIAANVFATNDLCSDYQRGYLFYTVRNSSALTMQFQSPVPKTIPEFFNTLTNGLLIVIPDNPSSTEIATGAWTYGILQKEYPYVPVKFIFASERLKYPNLPRIWVALHNHLPEALASFTQGIHLSSADTLVIAAQDDENLQTLVKQLAQLAIIEAIPSATISVGNQDQSNHKLQDKIYFGNHTAQEGILSVPIDFDIYPAMFSDMPQSVSIHLDGRYVPSNIVGKEVRLDVFLNRKLIHSELLDASGVLKKDIVLPNSFPLKAKNQLSLVFEYPDDKGYCKVKGMTQSVQIFPSSYVSGVDKFSVERFNWTNVGMLFNKKGLILLSDTTSPDMIRSVGELVLFMNKQLPSGVFAYPSVSSISQFSNTGSPEYLVLLGLVQDIPDEFQQGLPLQRSKDFTLYRGDGQNISYRYQSIGNTVLGQIGEYHGIPLLSISASTQPQSLLGVIQKLQLARSYNELTSTIFLVNEQNQMFAFSDKSFEGRSEDSQSSWKSVIFGMWRKILRFVEAYRRPFIWALGILIFVGVGKVIFTPRKK